MREIKFRAWDKKDKVVRDVVGMSFYHDAVSVDIEYGKYLQDDAKRFELMQYTGLKDKNGVKIYEGDVIEIREVADYIYEPNKITTFHKGCFGWRDNEAGFLPFCILDAPKESIEVIGNIYENPHLLECD